MRYGSVCSGIEAASVAWRPLGWEAAWLAEIEKFPSEVLKHHYPEVPNLGDMTKLAHRIVNLEIEAPDILVGGTPCQAFSVAGLRNSLEDDRGQLSLTYIHILDALDLVRRSRGEQPAIGVWENVPGVLSTKDNAFGCFLAGLVGEEDPLVPAGKRWSDAGYVSGPERTVAWRILDAQYFGVAQRRRRVFVVASARNGFNPAKVLFESNGLRRDTAPSREKGESSTSYTPSSLGGNRQGCGTLRSNGGDLGGGSENLICSVIKGAAIGRAPENGPQYGEHLADGSCYTLNATEVHGVVCMAHGQGGAEVVSDGDPSLTCNHEAPIVTTQYGPLAGSLTARHDSSPCADRGMNVVCFAENSRAEVRLENGSGNVCGALSTGGGKAGQGAPTIAFHVNAQPDQMNFSDETTASRKRSQNAGCLTSTMQVRRLTPKECERLQGFPDDYTNTKPNCPDGPRYKALGNSMCTNVMKWIGERIQKEVAPHVH